MNAPAQISKAQFTQDASALKGLQLDKNVLAGCSVLVCL